MSAKLLATVLLSLAMAIMENRSGLERLQVALRVFFCCGMTMLGGSWLMFLIHG